MRAQHGEPPPDAAVGGGGVGGAASSSSSRTARWRSRLKWELRPSYPMYSLEEYPPPPAPPLLLPSAAAAPPPPPTVRVDVLRSFAPPRPCCATPLIRCLMLGWSLHVLAYDVMHYPHHNLWIYMAWLTHWGHMLSNIYLACSLACSVYTPALYQPRGEEEEEGGVGGDDDSKLHRLVKVTWGLYSTVAPLEIGITLMYWSAISTDPPGYVNVMEHGGVALLVLLDGLVVGIVPVRAKHGVYLVCVCCAYLIWSALDYVLDIGNGDWGPAYQDDDSLYPILRWGSETRVAAFVSGFAVFVLCPLLFWAVWMMSLASRRAAAAVGEEAEGKDGFETEESGGCCCCCGCTCCCRCCDLAWDGLRRPHYRDPAEVYGDEDPFGYSNAPSGRPLA